MPTIDEVIQQQEAERTEAKAQLALTGALRTATPQQAVNWIDTNVTDLASAKAALKLMVRMLIVLRDQVKGLKD
jgi:hypothetical protein